MSIVQKMQSKRNFSPLNPFALAAGLALAASWSLSAFAVEDWSLVPNETAPLPAQGPYVIYAHSSRSEKGKIESIDTSQVTLRDMLTQDGETFVELSIRVASGAVISVPYYTFLRSNAEDAREAILRNQSIDLTHCVSEVENTVSSSRMDSGDMVQISSRYTTSPKILCHAYNSTPTVSVVNTDQLELTTLAVFETTKSAVKRSLRTYRKGSPL